MLVLEDDAERGLEIKKNWNSKSDDSEQVEISEWTCDCGATVDEHLLELRCRTQLSATNRNFVVLAFNSISC